MVLKRIFFLYLFFCGRGEVEGLDTIIIIHQNFALTLYLPYRKYHFQSRQTRLAVARKSFFLKMYQSTYSENASQHLFNSLQCNVLMPVI